ncbi:MAG: ComEC/Rec2 family competence protein [Bythopirellula sp.]|nr:ComEC/Rec2 family competence protein [Bythopirellula sp.]
MSVEFSEFRVRSSTLAAQPLLLVAVAVALGIVADRFGGEWLAGFSVVSWWIAALCATFVSHLLFHRHWLRTSLVALLFAFLFVGGAWHDLHWNYWRNDELARYATDLTEPVCIKAVATQPSQWTPAPAATPLRAIPAEPRSEVEVRITRIRNGTNWQTATGAVRLRVNGVLPDITPGDQLLVFARLSQLTPALNPGQYDYAAAERAAGRHCELFTQSPACVSVIESANSFSPEKWLASAGRWCQQQLARYVGFEQQPISQALLLGVRGELDDETMDAFMKTGTIHLLVVSGMHVGLIAGVVWMLTGLLPMSHSMRLGVTICLVVIYAAVVGWQPSVVRSTVLVLMTLIALAGFRQASATNCLAVAALAVLAMNPTELFRAGTQLSFLGVATVMGVAVWLWPHRQPDPLERMIQSYMPWQAATARWIADRCLVVLLGSTAVWCIASPLVLYHFHIISPSATPLTFLAWPAMAVALMAGLAICTVGFLFAPLAWLLGQLCGACMLLSDWLIEWGSQWPASYFYNAGPTLWWVLVFYGALGLMAVVPSVRPSWKTQATLAMLWIAVGLIAAAWNHRPAGELRCTFVAVGHGTCAVLEFPSGETLLYDAGSLGSPQGTTNVVASFLWSRGITHIDAIVISHADVDHYNGVPGLLERFAVGKIYISPLMFDPWATGGELTAPNFLKEKIDAAGVPLEEVWMNDHLSVGDERVNIEVLHPPRAGVPGRDNANSILLAIEFAGHKILLPGDLESPGIETVMAEAPLDVDVLLAPHHGSNKSDPPGFAAWSTPEWVILSGRYSPDETRFTTTSYRDAGAEILHTATSGAVEFTLSSAGITYAHHR